MTERKSCRIWITGEGGNLARSIRQHSSHRIFVPPMGLRMSRTDRIGDGELDVCDQDLVESWLNLEELDVVIHGAAVAGSERVMAHIGEATEVTIQGTMNIVEACNDRGIPLVYLSSSVIYGTTNGTPHHEGAKVHPVTAYGWLKVLGESIVQRLATVPWTIVRPAMSYGGPTDTASQLARFTRAALTGVKVLRMTLDPDKTKNWMRVEDMVAGIDLCVDLLARKDGPRVLNVGLPDGWPASTWFANLDKQLSTNGCRSPRIDWCPVLDHLGEHLVTSSWPEIRDRPLMFGGNEGRAAGLARLIQECKVSKRLSTVMEDL